MLKNRLYKPNLFFLSYKRVLSNSIFTASWIREFWGIESSLLYPPVKIGFNISNSSLERQPTKILSVGRFIDPKYGHSKNQLELVRAFRILEKESDEIFELHLVGGLDKRNSKYFEKVGRLSRNKKIFLHPNASSETLDHLYKTSALFWHATGLNVHDRRPEKMEHFGISVVEAIGNGLLPIVFDSAGPAEILVEFPELRFTNLKDLVSKTLNCRSIDSEFIDQLSHIPARYDEGSFYSEFQKLIGS
jgi:glycosyltransferase involved in cell wall biosynthesis